MRALIYRVIFLLVLGLRFETHAIALGGLPALSADNPIEFDQTTQELTATGKAQVLKDNFLVQADTIRFSRKTQIASTAGETRMTSENFRLVAENIRYDFEKKSFRAQNYQFAQAGPNRIFYVSGPIVEGNADLMVAKNAQFLSLPGPVERNFSDVSINSRQLEYQTDQCIIGRHNVFKIGKVPVFYLPYFRKDLGESLISFSCSFGSSEALGYFSKTTTIARLSPSLRLGMSLDYYSHRGVLWGPTVHYDVQSPFTDFKGDFDWGYIRDRGHLRSEPLDGFGNPIKFYRYFVNWNHKQSFLADRSLRLTSNLSYWKDSEVLKDFRPEKFSKSENPDTFAELVYREDDLLLTGFTRLRPNNFQNIVERLPEATFEFLPSPLLNTSLYHNFKGSYAAVKERPDQNYRFPRSYQRFDTYYGICKSIELNDFLSLMPIAGGRLTHYTRTRNRKADSSGAITMVRGQVGFDLVGKAFSVWDYQNELWKIDGIRHNVKPIVQYRYIPAARSGSGTIPPVDYHLIRNHLEPIDLGIQRNIDTKQEQNIVRFGLQNYFQTKANPVLDSNQKIYGSRDLLSVNFYQDVRLHRRIGEERLSDFFTAGSFTPVDWFDFSASHHYHFKNRSNGLNTATTIKEPDAWALTLGTVYSKNRYRKNKNQTATVIGGPINQVSLSWSYQLTTRYSFAVTGNYDARIGQLLSHTYTLSTLLGNHWTVTYGVEFCRNEKYDHEATFSINLVCIAF